MRRFAVFPLSLIAVCASTTVARAHVSIPGGTGFANQSQEITFGVGHGCEGADTLSVRVEIPAGVTSVRPVPSTFGRATVETDAAGAVVAVKWERPTSDLAPSDTNYYKLGVRARLPNTPFATLYFPARQICGTPNGATKPPVDWVATPAMPDAGAGEPAPSLLVLPARSAGWNKYPIAVAIGDLKVAFGDAQIVWKGTSAWSPSATTNELIAATNGVTPLTALVAGDVIWVKY